MKTIGLSEAILLAAMAGGVVGCNKDVEFSGTGADKKNPQIVLDKSFPAARVVDAESVYRPEFGEVSESLTLLERDPDRFTLRQSERPVSVDVFRQGHDGSLSAEEFDVSRVGKLDLLVVVDNSNSMADEQANLATKLSALTKHLKTTDWQVGVITTSSCALRNSGKPIKVSDPTAEADFAAAVNVGTGGSGNERGLLRAYQLFSAAGTCDNKWLRPDAALAMLFVSDEESFCSARDCPRGSQPQHVEDHLKNTMQRAAEKLKSYALVWMKDDPECKRENGETDGERYIDLANRLKGISGSICAKDYTKTLEQISKDVSRIVTREFSLKYSPANSLSLTIDGKPFNDYQISGQKITLNEIADTALKLKVTYRYDAVKKFDKVALTSEPDPKTVQVFVNNAPVDPAAFEYLESDRAVFFAEMPVDNAEVKVKFRSKGGLPVDFDLGAAKLKGPIVKVEVGGKTQSTYRFDPVTEVLTFDSAPEDGSLIAVFSQNGDPAITEYDVTGAVDLTRVEEVSVRDATDDSELEVSIDGSRLVFKPEDVRSGRSVAVTYFYGDKDALLQHELAHDPLEGIYNVSVVAGDEACEESVTLEGRKLFFNCNGQELQEVNVSYKYVAERFTEFPLDVPFDRDTFASVYVDGVRITDFQQVGSNILISSDLLDVDSVVRVLVTKFL